jgi:hypothetical protein
LAWLGSFADIIALALVAATTGLALAHSADFPSENAWSSGHILPPAQIAAVVLLVVAQISVVLRARRKQRNRELEDACREVAACIDEQCPSLPLREVGVHIWEVAGLPFARHLRRSGSFLLLSNRARSGIRWTKGKGVVGVAWQKERRIIKDIEAIRTNATSEESYAALPEDERLGLSWEEFVKTPRYQIVRANPLYNRGNSNAKPTVRGVVAVDVAQSGHFEEVNKATESRKFASVIGLCETAFED